MERERIEEAASEVGKRIKRMTRKMTLEFAHLISGILKNKAKELGVKAVICIVNEGGYPVLVECMDESYIASYDVAVNKAFTSVALKMSTKELGLLAQPGASLYGIQNTNGGRIVIFGGGEPLKCDKGKIVGGIGVSGGTEEQDTALAEYGRKYYDRLKNISI